VSTGLLLLRGALRRCPVCGQGKLFHRWFSMVETCPRCGFRFERIDGHWVGSLGMNTIVTFGALLVVVVLGLVLDHPDFNVALLTALAVGTAGLVPLVFFPFSRTIWTAIDLAMRPLEPWEADLRHVDVATGAGSRPRRRG
jgi:uncharacterized protein (DUF983 family)